MANHGSVQVLNDGYRSYSTLYLARGAQAFIPHIPPMSAVTLKAVRVSPDTGSVALATTSLQNLASDLAGFNHPNVWPVLGCTNVDGVTPALVSPYCSNGNILEYCQYHPTADKFKLIFDVAAGLEYLHQSGFAHKSVTPKNILIHETGKACLSDAGVSASMQRLAGTQGRIPSAWKYEPSEELNPQPALDLQGWKRVDVYCFGSTIYEIVHGAPPDFPRYRHHPYKAIRDIVHGGHSNLPQPPSISNEVWSIVQHCWTFDPNHRPSMTDIIMEIRRLLRDGCL